MRSGKGELAKYLSEKYGYQPLAFYYILKSKCTELLGLYSIEELDELKNSNKEISMYFDQDLCNKFADAFDVDRQFFGDIMLGKEIHSVRELLQTIGTDVLRAYDSEWHVNPLIRLVISYVELGYRVVIEDVRFPNEKAYIESIGGEVYYVDRKCDDERASHIAENSLSADDFEDPYIIENDSDVDTLISRFEEKLNAVDELGGKSWSYTRIARFLALAFIEYLDKNRPLGKMCLSGGECEGIEKAFNNMEWHKLYRYLTKYITVKEKPKDFTVEEVNDKINELQDRIFELRKLRDNKLKKGNE